MTLRPYTPADWPALWPTLEATVAAGDTFVYAPGTPEADLRRSWVDQAQATFVACDDAGALLGSYYLRPNQPGLGAHVCNAGYVVAPRARGQGVAAAMCLHSQDRARALGYLGMQFNFVVSTNERAVRLWRRHGFAIVGTLPGVYAHRLLGHVDAYVMYKSLVDGSRAPAVDATNTPPQTNLAALLRTLEPVLHAGVYAYAVVARPVDLSALNAVVTVREPEGTTVVALPEDLERAGLAPRWQGAWITLTVASALEAVGLTAAVARALADAGIACNVVAGLHHDHLFVPVADGPRALEVLRALQAGAA